MSSRIVLIGPADALPGLQERLDPSAEVQTFNDSEALEALDHIIRTKPALVAMEDEFSATSRGLALINRIKDDSTLGGVEVRVMARNAAQNRVAVKRGKSGTHAVAVVEPKKTLDQRGTRRALRSRIKDGVEIAVDGNPAAAPTMSQRNRGAFSFRSCTKVSDFQDGTSNTALMAERDLGNPTNVKDVLGRVATVAITNAYAPSACKSNCVQGFFNTTGTAAVVAGALPGERFFSGWSYFTSVTFIVPPNGCSCGADPGATPNGATGVQAIITPSSRHTGGCHVLMGDGTVRFVNENINSGTDTVGVGVSQIPAANNGQSPYGVWGAIGTLGAGETISDF